jgi:hypothetical protein
MDYSRGVWIDDDEEKDDPQVKEWKRLLLEYGWGYADECRRGTNGVYPFGLLQQVGNKSPCRV